MKNIFTDTLTRADLAFIEFGKMPKRDEWWDDLVDARGPAIEGWGPSIAVWLVGFWIPLIAAMLITGYLVNWNYMSIW